MRRVALSLGLVLLAGCALGPGQPVAKRPTPARASSPAVRASAPVAPAGVLTLQGRVRLVSDQGGGIISNNGGAIISDNGGGLISDKGGSLVSNNGGSVVANNGARYVLAATGPEALLADADVAALDAAGKPVAGPDGKPLAGRTDRQGRFAFKAALPAGNVLLRVKLWTGGELTALLARDGAAREVEQDVDTASSLGAAFVLDRYVKGDQAIYDKLPAAEARRLQRDLEAARPKLAAAPAYDQAALAAAADELRGKDAAVAKTLQEIRAILLGQAKLGDGRLATEVPLNRPYDVLPRPDGTLLVAEGGLGRLRSIDAEGRIATYADEVRGAVKRNFLGARDLVAAPDGGFWLACTGEDRVFRFAPDGQIAPVPLAGVPDFEANALMLAPDGALHVGGVVGEDDDTLPRWIVIGPDGRIAERTPPIAGRAGGVRGLAPAPDGGTYVYQVETGGDVALGTLFLVPAEGPPRALAAGMAATTDDDLTVGPDGMVYLSLAASGRVLTIAPDGKQANLAGPQAGGAAALDQPSSVQATADGTLYVSDVGTSRVWARDAAGAWRAVAGLDGANQTGEGGVVALNTPLSLAFDEGGRLLIAENGRHRIQRLVGSRLEVVAGGTKGESPHGTPVASAAFYGIAGLAARGGDITVVDSNNFRVCRLGADGALAVLAGAGAPGIDPEEHDPRPLALALDPAGRPYWTALDRSQVLRLPAAGRDEVVAGVEAERPPDMLAAALNDALPEGQAPREAIFRFPLGLAFDAAGDLYVADAGHMQVRKVAGLAAGTPRMEAFAGRGQATYGTLLGAPGDVMRDGPRLEADLVVPVGVCFDPAGNMYVSEVGTRRLDLLGQIVGVDFGGGGLTLPPVPPRVRKIAPDGTVTTVAGPGGRFFQDPDAEDALVLPTALAIGPDGRLAIADPGANLVRILPAGSF